MKIKEITSQHRRDFTAVYVCQGCGHEQKSGGYDDANYHEKVIPTMICEKCGKNTADLDAEYEPRTPKYPAGMQV